MSSFVYNIIGLPMRTTPACRMAKDVRVNVASNVMPKMQKIGCNDSVELYLLETVDWKRDTKK